MAVMTMDEMIAAGFHYPYYLVYRDERNQGIFWTGRRQEVKFVSQECEKKFLTYVRQRINEGVHPVTICDELGIPCSMDDWLLHMLGELGYTIVNAPVLIKKNDPRVTMYKDYELYQKR